MIKRNYENASKRSFWSINTNHFCWVLINPAALVAIGYFYNLAEQAQYKTPQLIYKDCTRDHQVFLLPSLKVNPAGVALTPSSLSSITAAPAAIFPKD